MTEHAKCRWCGGEPVVRAWETLVYQDRLVGCECGWICPESADVDEAAAWAEWDRVMGGGDAS